MPGFSHWPMRSRPKIEPSKKEIVARTKEARPETLARKRAADSAAEASPASSGLYSLAARIQKINPDKLIVTKLSMR